jgi:SAM-dependent methyltransferase
VEDPRNIISSAGDARSFESGIGAIKIGTTWKTTCANRHPLTDEIIAELLRNRASAILLDVGCSSGLTCADLIDRLGNSFSRYYVTDLFLSIPYRVQAGITYFYHPLTNECIIRSDGRVIAYHEAREGLMPLRLLAQRLLARAPSHDPRQTRDAGMLHPRLRAQMAVDQRIVAQEFGVFDKWLNGPVDIVKAANILNRGYFSPIELRAALDNLGGLLKPSGMLVVTDNPAEGVERISVFRPLPSGGLIHERDINGGAGVAEIM